MTGFGSALHRGRDLDIEVEARSVNHRFLTLKQSLPDGLLRHEGEIDQMARARIARGSVNLNVAVKAAAAAAPALPDLRRFKACHRRLREIQKALGMKGEIEMEDLLAVPSLWSSTPEAKADLWPRVKGMVARALGALTATRAREGAAIEREMKKRLDLIEGRLEHVAPRVSASVTAYQKKLDDRIQALLAQKGLEMARVDIVKEVALFADRCDVTEELQRLQAHVAEFRKLIQTDGPIGRRLDFLTQEMGREINTLASKGADAEISSHAVAVKAELEKIKEQVENVE